MILQVICPVEVGSGDQQWTSDGESLGLEGQKVIEGCKGRGVGIWSGGL